MMIAGSEGGRLGIILVVSAVPIVFVSIVGHELGHAWLRKIHGAPRSEIVLHGLGGYCTGPGTERFSKGQRVQVLAAGPFFNLLLAGLCFLAVKYGVFRNPIAHGLAGTVMMLNLFWGIFNLLPIWPMDGGQIFETLMGGSRNVSIVYKISFALAVALAIWGLTSSNFLMLIIMGQIAMQNWTRITGRRFQGF